MYENTHAEKTYSSALTFLPYHLLPEDKQGLKE